jgi:hypothetical protein
VIKKFAKEEVLSLPMCSELTDEQVLYTGDVIYLFFKDARPR